MLIVSVRASLCMTEPVPYPLDMKVNRLNEIHAGDVFKKESLSRHVVNEKASIRPGNFFFNPNYP